MRLDVSMLDELVCEYCVYRGIVDSGLSSPSGKTHIWYLILILSKFFYLILMNSFNAHQEHKLLPYL